MLYYNDEPVIWHGKKEYSEIEQKVRDGIEGAKGVRATYFGSQTSGKVRLLYPKGKPKDETVRGLLRPKMFPVSLSSTDGQWRWTEAKRTGRGYVDSHKYILHDTILKEKDVEFIWFLNNCSNVINRVIFIEDLEAEAKKEVQEMGADAALRFMLMNEYSPIYQDRKLIREIAEIFNVKGIGEMKENQTRVALYKAIKSGEEMGDVFCNFKVFDGFVNGTTKREIAHTTRIAIEDGIVGYSIKDRAWFIMSGKEYSEKLMSINAGQAVRRDELLIEEVINNPNVQERLFSAMGIEVGESAEKLRELNMDTLKAKYKQLTGEHKNIKKEELIELLCKELGIEYVPAT